MKLINQSAQYLPQQAGIDGIYKQIELAGRTSYLSWDKMTDDSAKKFVDMLIKSKHTSVLEHGTVYLRIPNHGVENAPKDCMTSWFRYKGNPYSKCTEIPYNDPYELLVTTNLRVLQENNWLDDLKYLCEPTKSHEKRLSVKVITDIGVTREFNRHRTFSIVEQSTRYCNFSKDKFGNELTFIIPSWLDIPEGSAYWHDGICFRVGASDENLMMGISVMPANFDDAEAISCYLHSLDSCNRAYMRLLKAWEDKKVDRRFRTGFKNNPLTPQQARQVLPLCTKTEVVYTASESDWRHFFDLRLFGKTGEPHPQMKQLAELIKQEFEKAGVWEGIMKYPSKYD